jgi:hypothetical protein
MICGGGGDRDLNLMEDCCLTKAQIWVELKAPEVDGEGDVLRSPLAKGGSQSGTKVEKYTKNE